MSPIFSSNSEASASELLENIEEMLTRCDIFKKFKSLTTQQCVIRLCSVIKGGVNALTTPF